MLSVVVYEVNCNFLLEARLAASAGNLLFFASFFPYNFISEYYGMLDLTTKITACLSANVALALGINILIKLEIQGGYWRFSFSS